jgi:hypothetical protein
MVEAGSRLISHSPQVIGNAISICKQSLLRLELYNTLDQHYVIVPPHIDFGEFCHLAVLKVSARIIFAGSDLNWHKIRAGFVKRLLASLEELEIYKSWQGNFP